MRDYANRHRWTVVGEFVERGVSAKTTDRPVLRELLARCKQEPKADVVLVHKVDRLGRRPSGTRHLIVDERGRPRVWPVRK